MKRKRSRSRSEPIMSRKYESKSMSMNGSHCWCCCGASKGLAWTFIIIGVLYLLQDLGWVRWWTVSWFTIMFLLLGFMWYKN